MWLNVAFGVSCAAMSLALGWRCLRQSTRPPRWWWPYGVGVSAAAALVAVQSDEPPSPAFVWFTAAALTLAGVDAVLLRLPNVLVYPTLAIVVMWLPTAAVMTSQPCVAFRLIGAGLAAGLGYLVLHMLSPQGLGMGDVKFAPAIAMVMAWESWAWVLVSSLAAFVLAAIWGLGMLPWRRGRQEIPFGPFMVAGAAVTPIVADPFMDWWI